MSNVLTNISSDPELFIREKSTGKIVSSIPIVKSNKENPTDLGDGFLCYCDNVSVECSIPVVDTREGFIDLIQSTKDKINNFIGDKYEVVPLAANNFTPDQLQDPGANEIGCSPFFIARSRQPAMPPTLPEGYRSAGFHLHIGRPDFKECNRKVDWLINGLSKLDVVAAMDVYVGIPSVLFDNGEASRSRKTIYTQSCSAHRPTPYGVEYRPLSSSVMRHPDLVGLVFDLTNMAIEESQKVTNFGEGDFGVSDEEAFHCIDKHDVEMAKKIVNKVLPSEMIEQVMRFHNEE